MNTNLDTTTASQAATTSTASATNPASARRRAPRRPVLVPPSNPVHQLPPLATPVAPEVTKLRSVALSGVGEAIDNFHEIKLMLALAAYTAHSVRIMGNIHSCAARDPEFDAKIRQADPFSRSADSGDAMAALGEVLTIIEGKVFGLEAGLNATHDAILEVRKEM